MQELKPCDLFTRTIVNNHPDAIAWIKGNSSNPNLDGIISFYNSPLDGVIINAELYGLPDNNTPIISSFYGMHIHENGDCSQDFNNTGGHYNPLNMPHPNHAGDLPPLLSNNGYAWTAFLTNRFTLDEIIGKSVIIHSMPDDFTTQPSGNSGEKIGCGIIKPHPFSSITLL